MLSRSQYRAAARTQRGVGLIEVLVTVLVLAVGLLGLAGLQLQAQRLNYLAYLDSQAQFLLQDLTERMRISQAPEQYLIRYGESASASVDCNSQNCDTSRKLAQWDLSTWASDMQQRLPSAEFQIERSGQVEHEYIMTIRYDDLRGEQTLGASMQGLRELSVVTRI